MDLCHAWHGFILYSGLLIDIPVHVRHRDLLRLAPVDTYFLYIPSSKRNAKMCYF